MGQHQIRFKNRTSDTSTEEDSHEMIFNNKDENVFVEWNRVLCLTLVLITLGINDRIAFLQRNDMIRLNNKHTPVTIRFQPQLAV